VFIGGSDNCDHSGDRSCHCHIKRY
jgi:hypothetical protein